MPSQGRLANSRSRVPNLDGFVPATAGNLLSIGAPRHRVDPIFVRSQHTNQQKQRWKLEKNLQMRVPGQRRLAISRLRVPNLDGFVTATAGNFLSIGTPRHRGDTVFVRSQQRINQNKEGKTWEKIFTYSSARSASTGNLQIASPKSWWYCHYYRWQFAFHRDSTTQTRPWNYEKSTQESTEAEREKLEK